MLPPREWPMIVTGARPLAVSVPPKIGGDDVPLLTQRRGDPVPVATMVAAAVDEEQGRPSGIAPVHVVEPQPLGEVGVRRRSRHAVGHRWLCMLASRPL